MKKLLFSLFLLLPFLSFSQIVVDDIELFDQYNGFVNFTAVGNTLNGSPNPCFLQASSSADLNLLPTETFLSAHLYWSGPWPSLSGGDYNVTLNGIPVTASRDFHLRAGTGNTYFSAYADVTDIVGATGNGTYTFSDLFIDLAASGACNNGTDFGGWTMYVIYEDPTVPLTQISLFDGLDFVSANNTEINIQLTGLDVSSDNFSKIGFLAWEGDASIANGEALFINGTLIDNPPLNPGDNAFNGTNSYTNSNTLFNMDLDFYDLNGLINIGDTTIDITLQSLQDFVMVNNIITAVNSELPDATITIDGTATVCEDLENMNVDYTVFNVNSTDILNAPTPIAFYINGTLVAQTQTVNTIPIDGSESGSIIITIPGGTPPIFNLLAVVDDIGNGTGIVNEIDETNNEFLIQVDLTQSVELLGPDKEGCIGTPITLDTGIANPAFTWLWYRNGILLPAPYTSTRVVTLDGTYRVEGFEGPCQINDEVEVHFNPQPVANEPEHLYQCNDGTNPGIYDLTLNDANIMGAQDPTIFTITYHETFLDSESGTNPIANPANYVMIPPAPQTIYARIEGVMGLCYDLTQFELRFPMAQPGVVPSPFEVCDQDQTGDEPVDLPFQFNISVLNGETATFYDITYHISQADADADINPLPVPYFVPVPSQTIYIRLENILYSPEFSCYNTTTVDIIVHEVPLPNPTPFPLVICDEDNNGFGEFDLSLADLDITGGDPDLVVSYHGTQLDAENGILPLSNPYPNDDIYNDVVWARVESLSTSCYSVLELFLEVRDRPMATEPAPLRLCDDVVADGITAFDLTVVEPEVLGTMDPLEFDLYYYEDELEAIAAGDVALTAPDFSQAIPNPTSYFNTSNPQTLYILVVGNGASTSPPNPNGASGCYDIVPLQLIVDPLPANLGPFEVFLCDDELQGSTPTDEISTFDLTLQDLVLTGGDPDLTVSWYATPGDELSDNPIVDPTLYQNTITPETVVARIESGFGCRTVVTVTLTVLPNPTPSMDPLEALVVCDEDNDGFVEFDLTLADPSITGGDPDLEVSYHGTQLDAVNEILPIGPLYTNDDPYNDSVWVRLERISTGCYSVLELLLEVRDRPMATEPAPLRACDDVVADGITTFDLTVVEPEVLGTMDPLEFDLYYYEDELEAIAAGDVALTAPDFSQAIPNPTSYLNTSNPQTLYILVVGNGNSTLPNNGASGCYDIVPLQLIVDPLPANLGPFEVFLCDDELQGSTPTDEISTFNLTLQDLVLTGGDPDLTVSWYATPGDELSDNPIVDPTLYQNTITPETVVARIESGFGCRTVVTVTLTVLPNPTPNMSPTPITACDNGDTTGDFDNGLSSGFDLTLRDTEILAGDPDVSILYYETLAEAQAGLPGTEIVGLYTNTVPYSQIVYARVFFDVPPAVLPCYTIVALELIVTPLPEAPTLDFIDPMFSCDEDGDGQALFDLTQNDPFVIGGNTDYLAPTYYESLADAEAGINAIASPEAFISGGQTIWVRLESAVTGCARISSFELEVGEFPVLGLGDDLYLCDDLASGSTTDGVSLFDLTQNTDLITQGNVDLTVFYYANIDDQTNNNPILDPGNYPNEGSPQTIYVSVLNGEGCDATTSFVITVESNPSPLEPLPLVGCDDANNNGFYDNFILSSKDTEIINGDVDVLVTYYETMAQAEAGDPSFALADPYSNIVPYDQTVYARVTRVIAPPSPWVNACYTIVPLMLQVRDLPEAPEDLDALDLLGCDEDGDGFYVFNLLDNQSIALGNNTPVEGFTVSYYESLADAELGINAVVTPEAYENTVTPVQPLWCAANNDTGCGRVSGFEITVVGLPVLGSGPFVMELCDDEIGGSAPDDQVSTFDLTQNDQVITNGDPSYTVFYYLTQSAQDNNEPIVDATSHQNYDEFGNVANPQELYVSVFGDPRAAVARFCTVLTLRVLPNPVAEVPDPLLMCDGTAGDVDGDGNDDDVDATDGISYFDLTQREDAILDGQVGVTIFYYESFEAAVLGLLGTEILDPSLYQNTVPNEQTVYVRVTREVPPSTLPCYAVVALPLRVVPLPDGSAQVEDLVVCELAFDGIGTFDLTQNDASVLNGQSSDDFEVSYYRTLLEAENDINPIVNVGNFSNTVNPQTIYVRIENRETGCYVYSIEDPVTQEVSLSFDLVVKEGASATAPESAYIICDNEGPSDGIGIFQLVDTGNNTEGDLQAQALASEILGGQDPGQFILTYHGSEEDAELGVNALSDFYTNLVNPQQIYARVTNQIDPDDQRSCYSVVPVILKVEQLPPFLLDETYRLCVDESGNPIVEEFGDPSPPLLDTGLDPQLYTFVWSVEGQVLPNEVGPSLLALSAGSYSVLVTEMATGCQSEVTTTVVASSPPLVYGAEVTNGAFAQEHVITVSVSSGSGDWVYQLDGGPFQDSEVFSGVSPGTHIVTISDANGCGTVSFEVGVVDYPEYMTPNGDGYHDTWNIIGIAQYDPTAKIYIFDRYGKLLKQVSPLGQGWDGTYNGAPLPSSDYWFRVDYQEQGTNKTFTGHFTLKR
ncbi:MAG: T9SS type B sorting domain-containing protein [Flavobacteriaceae bacterium]